LCKPNPDPDALPQDLRVPLDKGHIAAARATYRDNKGAEWMVCGRIGLQVGDYVELRDNLVRVLVERGVPTATIADAFDLSGREVWRIVAADPISLFGCLECNDPLPVRDRSEAIRMQRALVAARTSAPGRWESAALFCGTCIENVLERRNSQARLERLAQQARLSELSKMTYAEYLSTPEWRARRTAALAWAGYRCQLCNENGAALHVHHRVYTRRGDERPEDLVVLCSAHHSQFHGGLPDAS
jgi:5-methylcytosine-specific restriction endonuclease McrA